MGRAAVEWVAELRSSTSLDGSIQLQEGRDVRVTLNTPEDLMDIISLRYVFKAIFKAPVHLQAPAVWVNCT